MKKQKSNEDKNKSNLNIELLVRHIQECTNKIPLLILGSGSSVPFNLPSMWKLGEHLKTSISFENKEEIDEFEKFKNDLDTHKDLEKTLLSIQLSEPILNEVVKHTWELINKFDLEAYENIINNPKDFPLSNLISYLLSTSGKKVSILTTNYDRIAEYAGGIAGGYICTGFTQNFIGLFSTHLHKNTLTNFEGYKGKVNIWKVHGSLDWFKSMNEEHYQFPLRSTIPNQFLPSIVTPGLSKYVKTHNEPFRTILSQADTEIESATGYLCVGYGFNDEHVQPKLISEIKNNKKAIIVITKTLSDKAKELIIQNNCQEYILMEEDSNPNNTKVYSSKLGDHIIENEKYWELKEYLKLIK